MRFLAVFKKSMLEQARDPLGLSLTLVFAPLFVFLYWLLFPTGSTTYHILVLNQDSGATLHEAAFYAGNELISSLEAIRYKDGKPLLVVDLVPDRAAAEQRLKDRQAAALLIIPPGFSSAIQEARQGAGPSGQPVTFVGDLTNPYYSVAAVLANAALEAYIHQAAGQIQPVSVAEETLGSSATRSEFEIYVPGLLVFAVILLVFLAAMTVAREVETGAIRRLQITRMTSFDYMGGVCASLALIGLLAVALTFGVALALGFRSQGPLWIAVLACSLAAFSIIGVGLIVACFSRTVTQAFLIANFPLGLLMFFSGSIFPMPRYELFNIMGRSIALFDLLPPTHAVNALNKVFTLGAGLSDVVYELAALAFLSLLYFGFGVFLFRRRFLTPQKG